MDRHDIKEKEKSKVKTVERVRTAIATLLIFVAIGVLILEFDSLYYPKEIYNHRVIGKESDINEIALEKERKVIKTPTDTTFEQTFKAEEKSIFQFKVFFWNKNYYKTKGKVEVSLLDSTNEELAQTTLETDGLRHNRAVVFDFTEDSSLYNTFSVIRKWKVNKESWKGGVAVDRNKKYTIRMRISGIKPADDFGVFTEQSREGNAELLTIDGKQLDGTIMSSSIVYSKFAEKVLYGLIAIILMTALFVALLYIINTKKGDARQTLLSWLMLLVTPPLCYWMTYKIPDHSFRYIIDSISTDFGRINLLIIIGYTAFLFVIFNSPRVAALLSTLITYIFLSACYFLIEFRDAPLRVTDFYDLGAAIDVSDNYSISFEKPFLLITIIMLCFVAGGVALRTSKNKPLRFRAIALALTLLMAFSIYSFLTSPEINSKYKLRVNSFNPTRSYDELGYVFAFTLSFRDTYISKPEGYSREKVKEITADYDSDKGLDSATVSKETPNIIVIMNEAFSDLSYIGEIPTNKPYMPFFDSLEDNCIKGIMYPSVYGGGTANTEFEFLTGNTWAFLNMKTAYTALIKKERPSFARTLKEQGYKGMISFHPGLRNTYNRDKVYPYMGFDEYISLEDLDNPKLIRQYVSDEGDYETIINRYEEFKKGSDSNSPFFLFNVTIQNHSAFGHSTGLVDAGIEITDPELKMVEAEQFLNLMKKSDDAFKKFVNYFENKDEPTVIVMFGDHQPKVESEFYSVLKSRLDKDETEEEKNSKRFQVPFIIWSNFEIDEESDVRIGTNALAPYILDKFGLKKTAYDKFLLDLRELYPVISRTVLLDGDGKLYSMNPEELNKYENGDKLQMYNYIEYNNMNDKERIRELFELN